MPGILGFVDGKENRIESPAKLLEDMAHALQYKARYHLDLHTGAGVGLGRVSLGILNGEKQPIWNEDRTVCIVMEGEIFDYTDLKQDLVNRGYSFQVDNDPEFVLHLYEEVGKDFASKLNGAFIAAIWDKRKHELIIVNDRFGLQPLFYFYQNGSLSFASGVRALLADPNCPREVDPVAIAQLLSFEYVLGNRTFFNNVHLLPPASLLTFSNGDLTIQPYWSLQFESSYPLRSKESYLEGLIYHLKQALARQKPDNIPTGLLLSGGLDSRLVLAFLLDGIPGHSLHTFTFGQPNCDDARLAKELANIKRTKHHFFELKPDYLLEFAEEGIGLSDGLESVVHMHALATLSDQAQYAKVAYKGYMGDALFGGHLNRELWANYDQNTVNQLLFEQNCVLFTPQEHLHLFSDSFYQRTHNIFLEDFQTVVNESRAGLIANWHNHFDLHQRQRRFILNGVELVRSQMAVRVPFCDKDLVDFMLKMPPGLRLDRLLVVEILARYFPELAKVPYEGTGFPLMPSIRDLRVRVDQQIRWRLRGAGIKWVSPPQMKHHYANYNVWLRTSLRTWVEDILLSTRSLERGYFNPDYLQNLVSAHMNGANHASKIGALLSLELWHRQYID